MDPPHLLSDAFPRRNMNETPKPNDTPQANQPGSPEAPASPPLAPGKAPGAQSAKPTPPEKPVKPAQPSRVQRFFRQMLNWLIILLVMFTAGVIVTSLVRVNPLEQEKNRAVTAQATAEAKAAQLQTQLSAAVTDSGNLSSANAHVLLLHVLKDVTSAQLSLAQNAPADAKKALANTTSTLNSFLTYSSPKEADLSQSAKQRLALVLTEVDRDSKTSASDLGILSDQLLELEKRLFPGQ
jgi:hypothetical protein